MLFRELLDVVLAKRAQAESISLAHHRRREFLGNGHQRYLVARTTASADGGLNAMLDLSDMF
jgi:hypothetical protein